MIIRDYKTGVTVGVAEIDESEYEALGQWPEGVCRAGDLLADWQLEETGISGDTTIFCE